MRFSNIQQLYWNCTASSGLAVQQIHFKQSQRADMVRQHVLIALSFTLSVTLSVTLSFTLSVTLGFTLSFTQRNNTIRQSESFQGPSVGSSASRRLKHSASLSLPHVCPQLDGLFHKVWPVCVNTRNRTRRNRHTHTRAQLSFFLWINVLLFCFLC